MEELNLSQVTESLFQGFQIEKDLLIDSIYAGDFARVLNILWDAIVASVNNPIQNLRNHFIGLFLIGMGAVMLKQLHILFEDTQIQKTGFWIIYLILAKELLVLYLSAKEVAASCLEGLISFGEVFVPTFSAVLTLAAGSLTGAGYVATLSFVIYVIERVLLLVVIPIVEGYTLLVILGSLWQKERVEHILSLVEKTVKLILKGLFALVTGIGLLQSMILPFVDHTKVGAAKKIVELIPGVGKVSATTLEFISGTAIVLKNGVGVIGMILLLLVCTVPVLKIFVTLIVMKFTAVIYGLFEDKNMSWCVDKLGVSQAFLLKIIGMGLLLFLVWILLAVYTTNQRLWG